MPKDEIPRDIDERIDAIQRNDIDEAEEIMRECVYRMGYCPSSVAHLMFKYQDDDALLRGRVRGLAIRPMPGTAEVQ